MVDQIKLTKKERFRAIGKVAAMTYKTAPSAMFIQVFSSLFNAVLPIVTTYFAAMATTALADAFYGDETATQRVVYYVAITASLGVIMATWSTIEDYISQMLRYRIEAAVSDKMYEHFLRLNFWRYDDKDTIDIYEKAMQFARFFPTIFAQLAQVFSQGMIMVVSVVAMALVSWWLALVLVLAIVPGLAIQFRLSRLQTAHWSKNIDARRSIGIIEWQLLQPQNMAELRLYGMARYLLNLRSKLRDKDQKVRISFEREFIGKRLWAKALEAAAEVAALIWVAVQIIQQALPIGHFLYVQQIVSRALAGANAFAGIINTIDEDLANLVEYQRFMDMQEDDTAKALFKGDFERIVIDKVNFSYPQVQDTKVLRDVSVTIRKNQHVAIVGENGAGKSTLIKIIAGLYKPTSGVVLVDDTPLHHYKLSSWHKYLGALQQDHLSYRFATARDNVYFGDVSRPFSRSRFENAIEAAEARTFIEKLPAGADSYVQPWMENGDGSKGVELSGGQWQRLALARNFYRDSPIIVLDEPTSAVDALAESRIFSRLFKEKNKTIITVSHRLSTVKRADIIYMMKDGAIVEQGTYDELVDGKRHFYTMFKSQL